MRFFCLLFLVALLISSCTSRQESDTLVGVWESLGSGWILHIPDSTSYAWYDITAISCLPNRAGRLHELTDALQLQQDTLSLTKGVTSYRFMRAEALPERCATELEEAQRQDVRFNFDVFAATVATHYAYFELNGIDWEVLYQDQRAKLTTESTPLDLYLTIEETLEKLNDNHAFLEASDEVYEALDERESLHPTRDEESALPEYGDFPVAQMVADHHLQEEMTENSWLIQWGMLTDEIGFIQLKSMWLYAALDIPAKLIEEVGYVDAYIATRHQLYEGDYIQREVAGVRKIMDQVMGDLSDTKAIVIDIRFNGGGQDAVSAEVLSRFTTVDLQVGTQQLRDGDAFSPPHNYLIKGTENAYTKPVYVLTSFQTGSAAEFFALATISMDHVKRIGSATAGATSTTLDKTLPNRWTFSISNEIVLDKEGISYENKGIPADVEISYPRDRQTFFRSVVDDVEGIREGSWR